jgi:hypothetical protein
MNISIFQLKRQIAFCLAIALFAPLDAIAAMPSGPQSAAATEARLDNAAQSTSYPDSPGTLRAQAAGQQQQTDTSQSPPANQQNSTAPVGTAAAPYVKPEGVPASRPAGAVIAPAKQKRVHSFALRIGLLVGAGIAIGTVTALSLSNSSRPH